jgi:ubiquinone/menaquinone biosynthesis C-methylase UbiE
MTVPAAHRNQWLPLPEGYQFRRPGRFASSVADLLKRTAERRPFDATSDEYAKREESTAKGVWEYYEKFLEPSERRLRILDVASGSGARCTLHSMKASADFIAIDNELAVLRAGSGRRITAASVRFAQADATCLPFADGTFDICLCENALEHIPRPDLAIAEMARVLRANGHVFAVFPPWRGPFSGHLKFFTSFPWIHLMPRRLILWIVLAIHYPNLVKQPGSLPKNGAAFVDHLSGHMNGWSLSRLFRAIDACNALEPVDAYALAEWRVGRFLRFLPWVGEFFSNLVYVVYRKRGDGLPARHLVGYNSIVAEMIRRRVSPSAQASSR